MSNKPKVKVRGFSGLLKEFLESERTGGLILLASTVISMLITNSSSGASYTAFWHQKIDLSVAAIELRYSAEHWINDGLMAVFFLLVGLEIEREIYIGELANFRRALLPVLAAVGGMLVPAVIHFSFNKGTATSNGFGIPMATDIAFALGMLSLLGKRVPVGLKIFLTALAIIDDLGAILIIAFFYNSGLSYFNLGISLGIFACLLLLNRFGVRNLLFYLVPGVVMWYFMLKSGVHATITGVLLAFAIPFPSDPAVKNPSNRLQHLLHKPVAFVILPLFALANTCLFLESGWTSSLMKPNNIGIITGLFFGKFLGIFLFSWMTIKLKLSELPAALNFRHIAGAAILGGIGFTMAIFIANLAFNDPEIIQQSKIAILAASLLSCVAGLITVALASGASKKLVN